GCAVARAAVAQSYTLSLHDALPIYHPAHPVRHGVQRRQRRDPGASKWGGRVEDPLASVVIGERGDRRQHGGQVGAPVEVGCAPRSEEHTSELQSREKLVCRLLLEKK